MKDDKSKNLCIERKFKNKSQYFISCLYTIDPMKFF